MILARGFSDFFAEREALRRVPDPFLSKVEPNGSKALGIFDDVAQALAFDEKSVRLVVSNIGELRKVLLKMQKCLSFFPGVDRTVVGYEGLLAAQQHLPNTEVRDKFAAEYSVLANTCRHPHLHPHRPVIRFRFYCDFATQY